VSSFGAIYWHAWRNYTPMKTTSMMAKRYPWECKLFQGNTYLMIFVVLSTLCYIDLCSFLSFQNYTDGLDKRNTERKFYLFSLSTQT
jgi:hypothetical protein